EQAPAVQRIGAQLGDEIHGQGGAVAPKLGPDLLHADLRVVDQQLLDPRLLLVRESHGRRYPSQAAGKASVRNLTTEGAFWRRLRPIGGRNHGAAAFNSCSL